MLNDTIISGLLNLFALLSSRNGCRVDDCVKLIDSYLGGHFGIRNKEPYLDLFQTFLMTYEDDSVNKEEIVLSISTNIKNVIEASELKMLQLRLMEFCKETGDNFDPDDALFKSVAKNFGVSEELYKDFVDFVENRESDKVKIQRFDGYDGYIRTLWVDEAKKMVFSYSGKDEVLLNDVPVVKNVFQIWHESCVMKNHKGAPLYFTTIHQAYETKTERTVEFCGRNIDFRFPNSDNGMHNFSFTLHSGELVAIMGGSGTGKTTLLSLLNGTLHPQSGTITINGHATSEPAAKDLIGFVPQDDLLIEELTVYQNLYYTAKLCFDGISEEETDKRVMDVLRNLGLENAKDLKVGSAINKTISGGQRKRLNIALELIREPAVLMLDEPTSGLSSADTEHVVGLLKEQTYKGRLVIVNIHQPSSDVYKLFDRLWLLDKGGYPVFDGNPIDAITYFKTSANYADADTSTCPTCGNVNPEVVLNIIDEKAIDNSGNISSERKTSPKEWNEMYLKNQQPKQGEVGVSDVPPSDQKKPGVLKQFFIQFRRNVMTKITNVQYLLITLLEAPLLAVICSWLTRYAPESGYTVIDNKNFVSFLFMAVIVSTFIGMSGSAEEIIRDRALLKREKFLNLSYGSYISSKVVLLAIVSLLQTFLFVVVSQWIMGFHDLFFQWWIILFAAAFVANLTGLLLSQCLNSVVAIYITIPLLLIPQILLCGVVVDFNDLNGHSKTGNVPLLGDIIPSRWAYEALAVTSFADNACEQPLFDIHCRHYQDQYYRATYVDELDSQLETLENEKTTGKEVKPEHWQVISTSLPRLAEICEMEPYQGDSSYSSIKAYLEKADKVLLKRGNKATLDADRIVCEQIKEMGHEEYRDFRNSHTNRKLESVLINEAAPEPFQIIDGTIVAQIGQIYFDPVTHDGRAPFYSAYKQIGDSKIKTIWFNLMVLALMAIITAILIYTDTPGRYMRKE